MSIGTGDGMEFAIHDEMDIASKSCSLPQRQRRSSPTFLVMPYWRNTKDRKKLVVVKGTTVQINHPHSLAESMSTHNHEEADTMIPLHVIDAIGDST